MTTPWTELVAQQGSPSRAANRTGRRATSRTIEAPPAVNDSSSSSSSGCGVPHDSAHATQAAHSELRAGWRLLVAAVAGHGPRAADAAVLYRRASSRRSLPQQFGWSFAGHLRRIDASPRWSLLFGGPGSWSPGRSPRGARDSRRSLAGRSWTRLPDARVARRLDRSVLLELGGPLGGRHRRDGRSRSRARSTRRSSRRGAWRSVSRCPGIGLFALDRQAAGRLAHRLSSGGACHRGNRLRCRCSSATPVVLWGCAADECRRTLDERRAPLHTGSTLKEAVRTRAFVILVCAFVVISFANGAPIPHLENILRSVRIDPAQAITTRTVVHRRRRHCRPTRRGLAARSNLGAHRRRRGASRRPRAAAGCCHKQSVTTSGAALRFCCWGSLAASKVDLAFVSHRPLPRCAQLRRGVRHAFSGSLPSVPGAGPSLIGFAYDRLRQLLADSAGVRGAAGAGRTACFSVWVAIRGSARMKAEPRDPCPRPHWRSSGMGCRGRSACSGRISSVAWCTRRRMRRALGAKAAGGSWRDRSLLLIPARARRARIVGAPRRSSCSTKRHSSRLSRVSMPIRLRSVRTMPSATPAAGSGQARSRRISGREPLRSIASMPMASVTRCWRARRCQRHRLEPGRVHFLFRRHSRRCRVDAFDFDARSRHARRSPAVVQLRAR